VTVLLKRKTVLDWRTASGKMLAVPSSTVRRQRQPTRTALGKQERLRVTAPGTRPSPLPRRQWPGIPARSLVIAQPIEQGFLLRLPTARAEPAPSRKPRSARRTTRRLPPSSARIANSIASDAESSHFLAAVDWLAVDEMFASPPSPVSLSQRVAGRFPQRCLAGTDRLRHELNAAHRPPRHRVSSERDTDTSDAALASFSSQLATRVDRQSG
jgi:hypothetical protein